MVRVAYTDTGIFLIGNCVFNDKQCWIMKESEIIKNIENELNCVFENVENGKIPYVEPKEVTLLFEAQKLLERISIRLKNHNM